MVITRNRNSIHNVYSMEDARQNGKNFIVHTNYDREVEDPAADYRRVPAEQKMDKLIGDIK